MTTTEKEVMTAVYELCDGTDGCLISPYDILSILPAHRKYNTERIEDTLYTLHIDGYLDLITSERHGEKMYVISLKESGLSFKRKANQQKKDFAFKIFLAFVGAFATFIFGLILNAIF